MQLLQRSDHSAALSHIKEKVLNILTKYCVVKQVKLQVNKSISYVIKKISKKTKNSLSCPQKVAGTAERPRLAVYRSNKEMYAQLIDDVAGHTLCSASTTDKQGKSLTGPKSEKAKVLENYWQREQLN